MAMNFSTLDALSTLCKSIPDWIARLEALRVGVSTTQIELARLTEKERPPSQSLKNKSSTESLRPNDSSECKPNGNGHATPQQSSSAATLQAAMCSSPPPEASSSPQPSPRYKTRSMIIIHYDGAMQTAFEELVKFVSGSRNAMRKGKMAAKMAEMRRAVELENDADDNDDLAAPTNCTSTRQIEPMRYFSPRASDTVADIFDELDKALEWCQGQGEHAAYQLLRVGDCSTEIANITGKLEEVRVAAEKESDRINKTEAANPSLNLSAGLEAEGRGRIFKAPLMRKKVSSGEPRGVLHVGS